MEGFNEIQLQQIRDVIKEVVGSQHSISNETVTVSQASKLTGLSKMTIRRMAADRQIASYKPPNRPMRVSRKDLLDL